MLVWYLVKPANKTRCNRIFTYDACSANNPVPQLSIFTETQGEVEVDMWRACTLDMSAWDSIATHPSPLIWWNLLNWFMPWRNSPGQRAKFYDSSTEMHTNIYTYKLYVKQ